MTDVKSLKFLVLVWYFNNFILLFLVFNMTLLILLLILSLNLTSSQLEPNFSVIYSLASIHFELCFKHMNPCFTTLYNQMLSFAIGLNFHILHHHQLQQSHVLH